MTDTAAKDIIEALKLAPHPEGGWFAETWRANTEQGARASGTAIYYLLEAGQRSHWHRIDAAEIWHFYAGAPLSLAVAEAGRPTQRTTLGPNIATGARPQVIIPPGHGSRPKARARGASSAAPFRPVSSLITSN